MHEVEKSETKAHACEIALFSPVEWFLTSLTMPSLAVLPVFHHSQSNKQFRVDAALKSGHLSIHVRNDDNCLFRPIGHS
jgi:hypothetical protein